MVTRTLGDPAQADPPSLAAADVLPSPRSALSNISPYQPGMTVELARRRAGELSFAKLSSNENVYGPSPRAVAAAQTALLDTQSYPDSTCGLLRQALSEHVGVAPDRLAIGPGSEAVIDYFFRAYLGPGAVLLRSAPTFPSYDIFALSAGAELRQVPRRDDFELDVPATIAALRERPSALALCTPNNPTGNLIPRSDLERILEATPRSTLVLLDEAYFEFQTEPSALDLLEGWGGLFLLTRTFSKAYGLAGLRVGYGVASSPEVVAAMDRLRPAFNVTRPSQAAALAALADQEHLRTTVPAIVSERARIEQALSDAGLLVTRSGGNFVFVRCWGPREEVFDDLLRAGLIVRPIPIDGDTYFRITVGRPEDNDRLIAQLPTAARQRR